MERKLLLHTALLFLAVACSRGVDKLASSSSVTIRTPNSLVSSGGAGTLVALPAGRAACYGINILGAGPDDYSSCGPMMGIFEGFVPAGGAVTLDVPSKKTVKIQLFLYLKASGSTSPCPEFLPEIPASQIADTYLVGESANVYIDGGEMSVTINGTFPGVSQNIAQTLSLPASCTASSTSGPTNFSVSAGAQTMTGTGFNMTARAGKPMKQVLTGTGFKMIVR